MRRNITPDPPEPVPMDDTPTDQLGPPAYDTPQLCGSGAGFGASAVCNLPAGHEGLHLYDPIDQPRCGEYRTTGGVPWTERCTLPRGHVLDHEYGRVPPIDLGDDPDGDLAGYDGAGSSDTPPV